MKQSCVLRSERKYLFNTLTTLRIMLLIITKKKRNEEYSSLQTGLVFLRLYCMFHTRLLLIAPSIFCKNKLAESQTQPLLLQAHTLKIELHDLKYQKY